MDTRDKEGLNMQFTLIPILAKACLSNEDQNIYFLLMTKCDVIAKSIGVPEMKMICMKKNMM